MSSDFQRQDEPWTAPNCTQAALNAPDEHFKAKVVQSVRVVKMAKVVKCVRVVQNHDFKPPLSGKSGQTCVRVVQNHTCQNSVRDLPDLLQSAGNATFDAEPTLGSPRWRQDEGSLHKLPPMI